MLETNQITVFLMTLKVKNHFFLGMCNEFKPDINTPSSNLQVVLSGSFVTANLPSNIFCSLLYIPTDSFAFTSCFLDNVPGIC